MPPLDTRALRVDCIRWIPEQARWQSRVKEAAPTIEEVLSTDVLSNPGIYVYLFPNETKVEKLWSDVNPPDPLCGRLSEKFHIPDLFWSKTGWDANGFYRSRANTFLNQNVKHSYNSSFRFLLKQVELVPVTGPTRSLTGTNMLRDGGEEVQYDWEFYGLHSFWAKLNGPETDSSSYSQVLLCFDFVDKMKSQTINMFGASNGEKIATVPFGVHDVLLEILTKQYDTALWGFRTPVRNYEKRRLHLDGKESKGLGMLANRYENMHELERHIIHATETLKVASMTLEAMIRDHNDFTISRVGPRRDDPPKILETEENLGRSLHFYSNFFKSLQLRADAFEERLQNEIRLAFNTVAAHDSAISKGLQEQSAAQLTLSAQQLESLRSQNSSLTTTVSLLTLIFLPGSFISGFFGTNFFAITSNGPAPPQFSYVKELWIFFAVTVPITLIALVTWHYATKQERNSPFRKGRKPTLAFDLTDLNHA